MSDIDRWIAANDRYLHDELRALRRRIAALADGDLSPPAETTVQPQHIGLRDWFRARAVTTRAEPVAPPVDTILGPEAAEETPDVETRYTPALVALAQRLGLSEFERGLLLMCAAMEFDTGFGALCAQAQSGSSHKGPTFELAFAALGNPAWDAMSPERPLRYWRLIEIHQPGSQPLVASALRADERIVNYIKGLNYLDDRLVPLIELVAGEDDAVLPPSQAQVADAVAECIADAGQPPLFQLLGGSRRSTLAVARDVAARFGVTLYRLRGENAPLAQSESETFIRLWQRETALLPLALYIDADDVEGPQEQALLRLLNRCGGMVFVATRRAWQGIDRPTIAFTVAKPLPAEQQAQWLDALGAESAEQAALLSGQFDLDRDAIRAIAARAGGGDQAERNTRLWNAALDETRPALDQLADPIVPKASWDTIELPTLERAQLAEIAMQVRNRTTVYDELGFRARLSRGLGITVLFAGDSGTGKTMAAEVLARELGLLLYRIDLSGVVSKYIGETEKNLRKVFDAAEDGGAILLFDEADALFGKRSEVKDSHDRHANIETGYLLQRMESYRGLAILTTNMKSSLDRAFMRRIRFIVDFRFPGAPERRAIWQKVFPPQVDTGALDLDRLARLNLTGGSIHNIALNATFAAVAAGSGLTMPIVLEAARGEFLKLERAVNETEFRWLESVGETA